MKPLAQFSRIARIAAFPVLLLFGWAAVGCQQLPAHGPDRSAGATGGASDGSADDRTLTSIVIESTGGRKQLQVPITFGQPFAPGTLSASDRLEARLADGSTLPLQVDAKATHPDGSLRHAIISAVIPTLAPNEERVLRLRKAEADGNRRAEASADQLLAAGFSAGVEIVLDGQSYHAAAEALLAGAERKTWLAGAIADEWLVSAPLKNTHGNAHPHLTARFAIRSYRGIDKARVDVVIENNWAFEPGPSNLVYDVQIQVGGQVRYARQAMTHYHHARWRKTFWWGAEPEVHVMHDSAYLMRAKAVPNYDRSIRISPAVHAGYRKAWSGARIEPMGIGLAYRAMPAPGARPDIGLLPAWTVSYLLSMDRSAREVTLGTADLAGSWSMHYRDKQTDRPVSLQDYPYMTLLGNPIDTYNPGTGKFEFFPSCAGDCTSPYKPDTAHTPSFSYVPYLLTGDHYHLEELQFWAMWTLFQSNPRYRERGKGLYKSYQVRSQGWALRTLAHAAYATPDSDPLKAQFTAFLDINLDWYNREFSDNPEANRLGVLISNYAVVYRNGLALAPWMDDFFTQAVGHVAELGFAQALPLLKWKARYPVARMTDPQFCWILGAAYTLDARPAPDRPLYGSVGEVYRASFPAELTALPCASAEMAQYLNLAPGEMRGYSHSPTGFPSNLQPALAYSVDAGADNSTQAWNRFISRAVKPDYSRSPQFAIVPR